MLADGVKLVSVRVYQNTQHMPFLFIQKCAASALSSQLRGNAVTVPLKDYEGPLAVMWRNPADRLESAYRMFFQKPDLLMDRNIPEPQMGFDAWAHKVMDQKDSERDLHVASMTYQSTAFRTKGFMPTRVYSWDFAQVALDYGVPGIDVRNATDKRWPLYWSQDLYDRHLVEYSDDWRTWG